MATVATTAIAYAAAALAGGAYLNAKFGIGTDLQQIRYDNAFGARLMKRVQEAGPNCTFYGMFNLVAPETEFLWFEGKTWTYGEIKNHVNRLASVLSAAGVKSGDYVACFTTNSPEMVIAILAISQLGAVAPLINTNLRGETFTHCMNVANAKYMVSTPDLSPHVLGSLPHFSLDIGSFAAAPKNVDTVQYVKLREYQPYSAPSPPKQPSDICCLIYTSGTTGRPKACGIRNFQCYLTSTPLSVDVDNKKKYYPLRTYSALPLFHGTAIFTGLCYSLGNSGTLCIRRKFSATGFFKDVHDSRATRILYIGELCRYLLASPQSPYDKNHSCIVASGNGLRREIWEDFKTRFNIPEIREFYRSTEGLAKFDNFGEGVWGAGRVGFFGPIRRRYEADTLIVKFDPEGQCPLRHPKTGFCIKAGLDEPGEVIGRVKSRALLTEYLGNTQATEEKLLYDVFVKGDCWQRMGDLAVMDCDGWVRFHDRIGDSFRWKGENVSAGEVRDLICEDKAVEDAVVFGIRLASYDGQAGGATITLKTKTAAAEEAFVKSFYASLQKRGLPSYAFPRLIRVSPAIGTGVTFKQGKGDEAKKSWNPSSPVAPGEHLYWLDGTSYRPLDAGSWLNIEKGLAKL